MAQITSSVGLVSGINSGAIIDQLIALDSRPVTLLQTRISSNTAQKQALTDLQTQLQSLQTVGKALELPTTFSASTANSSDPNVLTASTAAGAPPGSYQFQVAQLVSSQQSISNGFNSTSTPLQAGTLTIQVGGGNLNTQTNLSDLNGGAGVGRGQFRLTDRSGKTDVIDTTSAVTLDDVVNQINTSLNVSVHASIQNDHLVLADSSGGTGNLIVQDLANGSSAKDLGIAASANGATLTGTSISYLSTSTTLASLNDGRGLRTTTGTGDFVVTTADGTATTFSVGNAQTVGDLLNSINTVANGKLKATVAPGGKGITLTDTSGGSGSFTVADSNGSHAADDLGILKTGSGGVINGDQIISGLDTVLVSSLNGGAGLSLGQFSVTNRGNHQSTVDLSGARTVQDVIDTINQTSGIGVSATLNSSGNGIQLQDTSGGSGNLVIGDVNGGSTAQSLGIAGTFNNTKAAVNGGDLHLQYVTQNTTLSSYNGGKGVGSGSFKITTAAGTTLTLDLSQGTFNTLGDVMSAINSKNAGVTASINANGNGIQLTDTSVGPGHLSVTNVSGTAASDLNILGTAAANTIDGAQQKSIDVTSSDTLTTLQAKIQALGFGVAAGIINDGSAQNPYRLSLTSVNSGKAGRVVIDGGTTGLQLRNLVQGQDAAVFVGGTGSSQPLLVTSSSNQITSVTPGVTLSLQSASSKPVNLSITRDGSGISKQLQTFTDTFNGLIDKLATYTKFDTTTNQGGVLLGDPTAQAIQTQIYAVFSGVVTSAGRYRTLGDVGLTVTDGAKIQFDSSKFDAAFAQDGTAVKKLFTTASTGLGAVIDSSITQLVDPVSGTITQENKTLDTKNQDFQDQITQLNSIIADKKTRLQTQFANMESVLANLQSQASALSAFTGIKPSTGTTSTSSPSSDSSSSSSTSTSGN